MGQGDALAANVACREIERRAHPKCESASSGVALAVNLARQRLQSSYWFLTAQGQAIFAALFVTTPSCIRLVDFGNGGSG